MFQFRQKTAIFVRKGQKFVIQIIDVTFSWVLSIIFAITPSLIFIKNFQTFFNFWICQFPFTRFDKLFSHDFITKNILAYFFLFFITWWSLQLVGRPCTEDPWPLVQGRCLGDSRKGGSNFKGLKLLYTLAYF